MSMKPSNLQLSVCPDCGGFGGGHADTCPLKGKDLLWVIANLRAENATLRQAIKNHAEEAAKMVSAEPVAYWNGKGSIIPAEDVSYLPNWSDYYPIPLYRRPQA